MNGSLKDIDVYDCEVSELDAIARNTGLADRAAIGARQVGLVVEAKHIDRNASRLAVALGGDCLADAGALRAEPALFGPVASDPVISRLVSRLAADAPAALTAIGTARAAARGRAWLLAGPDAPGCGGELIVMDIDATLVTAHSDQGALPHAPRLALT